MEFRTLQYFLVVAQEENLSKAAEVLHITQPTLSRQMQLVYLKIIKPTYRLLLVL